MELRRRVGISSSWDVSGDISAVLYVMNSSGSLLDEPLSGEQTSVTLAAPVSDSSQPCHLLIDLSQLRGYIPSRMEFTTSSRTTELYCGSDCDEYIGTVRGTLAPGTSTSTDSSGGVRKLYSCSHDLPSGTPCQNICIKLLSLRGRSEVLVDKIQLVVSEDHGGSAAPALPHHREMAGNGVDIKSMLSSLPGGSVPPFMQTLVSSLTQLSTTTQISFPQRSQVDKEEEVKEEEEGERPVELSSLMETLRQMRPPLPKATPTQSELNSNGHDSEGENFIEENGTDEKSDQPEESDSHRTKGEEELETRLKQYIDEKFEDLEKRLESKLEQLLVTRLKSACSHKSQLLDTES